MDPVLAYIDAASGSLLAQLLVGGLAGIGAFMKFRWHTIRSLFGSNDTAVADETRVD